MLDYASILSSSQGLVPDLRRQAMEDEVFAERRAAIAEQRATKEQARVRQAGFQTDMEQALLSKDPDAIVRLMARYPEFSEQVKPLWESMDERQRTTDLTQLGSIYSNANAGNVARAAAILEQRITADRAAGQVDPNDEAILAGLKSDNPIERQAAVQTVGMLIAALDPAKFGETYGKLNPTESKTNVQREYDWRTQQFGKKAADEWLATQDVELVVGEPGAPIFNKRDFIPRGGDPASGGRGGLVATPEQQAESARLAEQFGMSGVTVDDATGVAKYSDGRSFSINNPLGPWIEQLAGITASSRQRATGVPGTYHADDNARDFPTPTPAQNVAEGRRLKALFGPAFDVVYSETDKSGKHNSHVHVEPGPALGAKVRARGVVAVKSVQQAKALKPGTRYRTPDGREFLR